MTALRVRLGDVGSTNDEAMARVRASGVSQWVTAERQLSGRGRRGRHWVSEPGNLYASLGFLTELSVETLGILPLGAAVALGDAVAALGAQPQHKWPNDILIDEKKLSGILIETEVTSTARRVVTGFGVNIAHCPPGGEATALAHHLPRVTPDILFEELAPRFEAVIATLGQIKGFETIRTRWLDRAIGVGAQVTVRFEHQALHGRFVGLDPAGRLILDQDGVTRPIAAGDVFIRTETL